MRKLKKFYYKYRDLIITGSIVALLVMIFVLSLAYLLADIMIPGSVFFLAAVLMLPLSLNYSRQHKKKKKKSNPKGVYVFFSIAAAACVLAGLLQIFFPAPQ